MVLETITADNGQSFKSTTFISYMTSIKIKGIISRDTMHRLTSWRKPSIKPSTLYLKRWLIKTRRHGQKTSGRPCRPIGP